MKFHAREILYWKLYWQPIIYLPLQHYLETLPFYDISTILTRFIIFLNFFQIQEIRRFRQEDRGFNKFYLTALQDLVNIYYIINLAINPDILGEMIAWPSYFAGWPSVQGPEYAKTRFVSEIVRFRGLAREHACFKCNWFFVYDQIGVHRASVTWKR